MVFKVIDEYSEKIKKEITVILEEKDKSNAELANKIESLTNESKLFQDQLGKEKSSNSDLSNEINTLKETIASLEKKNKSLENQVVELGGEIESHKAQTEQAMQEAEKAKTMLSQTKTVRESLEGYRRSVPIITDWVPSQREAIEVLVACCEIENITLDDLASRTKIAPMILKRNVLPRLENSGFIKIEKVDENTEIINLGKL